MIGLSITTRGKGKLLAVLAAAMLSFVVAFGFAVPAKASAAEGGAGLAVGSVQATTQDDVTMRNPEWVTLWAGIPEGYSLSYFLSGDFNGLKVTKVISSDSSVLKVKKAGTDKEIWNYSVHAIKAGKAKLSVTISQNGVTKTLSDTYTVKTFPNAFKSITFNGQSLTVPSPKAPKNNDYIYAFKGTKATLSITPTNGWEVMYMSGSSYKEGNSSRGVEIKNGQAFTIRKGEQGVIFASLYNKTTGENLTYELYLIRNQPLELVAKPTYYIGYPKISTPQIKMIYGNSSDIKVISVKSSKPAVIKVKKNASISKVALQPMKPGKSKITIKYKFKGKTYTATATSTVSKDYPVKSVAVNGKSLNLKKNCSVYFQQKYKKNSATVKIAAAKGWKVKSLKYYYGGDSAKTKKLKNGASVKTPKGKATTVIATLKKGKSTYTYHWFFNRA